MGAADIPLTGMARLGAYARCTAVHKRHRHFFAYVEHAIFVFVPSEHNRPPNFKPQVSHSSHYTTHRPAK